MVNHEQLPYIKEEHNVTISIMYSELEALVALTHWLQGLQEKSGFTPGHFALISHYRQLKSAFEKARRDEEGKEVDPLTKVREAKIALYQALKNIENQLVLDSSLKRSESHAALTEVLDQDPDVIKRFTVG